MPVIEGLIRIEPDGSISFGDYTLEEKTKITDFKYNGSTYKIKTFKEVTKLKRDGNLVYESTPGTVVMNFKSTEDGMSFSVESDNDSQITVELEPEMEYVIFIDGQNAGSMKTNAGGKLVLSVATKGVSKADIEIKKA